MKATIERISTDSYGNTHLMITIRKPYIPGYTAGSRPYGHLPDSETMKRWELGYAEYVKEHQKYADIKYVIDKLRLGDCELFQNPVEQVKPFDPDFLEKRNQKVISPEMHHYTITGRYCLRVLAENEAQARDDFMDGLYDANEIELDEDYELSCDDDVLED